MKKSIDFLHIVLIALIFTVFMTGCQNIDTTNHFLENAANQTIESTTSTESTTPTEGTAHTESTTPTETSEVTEGITPTGIAQPAEDYDSGENNIPEGVADESPLVSDAEYYTGVLSADGTKRTFMDKTYDVIVVDGGDLSGDREANVAVDIGFGDREYWAYTNEYGQLAFVTAEVITLQDHETEPVLSTGRYYADEAKVPGTESADLDEGHVIADSLGGVSNAYNITPQDSTLNRYGDQAYMEDTIRDAGGCTDFFAVIEYPDTETQIPALYQYTYVIDGEIITDEFANVNPDDISTEEPTGTHEPTASPSPTPTHEPTVSPSPTPTLVPTVVPTSDTGSSADDFDEEEELQRIDTNGNGTVTIAEAKAAGYTMPIKSDFWLYKYMIDRDGDGMVGE